MSSSMIAMECPMRVLQAVSIMNRGGLETLVMNLYRHVDRSKIQFDFLVHRGEEGHFDDEIAALGGTIHRIGYIDSVGHLGYVHALDNFFKSNKQYRIVHSHMNQTSGLILRSARRYGIPVRIAHSHACRPRYSAPKAFYKWLIKTLVVCNATDLCACSNDAALWLFGRKNAASKTKIIRNGIETDAFHLDGYDRDAFRRSIGVHPGAFVIGHVGRFDKGKNQAFLVDVLGSMAQGMPRAELVLAGDGTLINAVREKARLNGLSEKTHFLGIRKDIPALLSAFDAFVFPSLFEGLPLTLVEAQAAGLPCIVSDSITREVDLGANLVQFVSLKSGPEEWARRVLSTQRIPQDTIAIVRKAGYDISESAKDLERFYIDRCRV